MSVCLTENGCGVFTKFFSELATTCNKSIADVIFDVRKKICEYVQQCELELDPDQFLVYDHYLEDAVNLLAESTGIGSYNYFNWKYVPKNIIAKNEQFDKANI